MNSSSSCRRALRQRSDDLVHVAAGAEVAAGAGEHDGAERLRRREVAEAIAQFGVELERQRVLALGPIERDGRDARPSISYRALVHRMRNGRSSSYSLPALLRAITRRRYGANEDRRRIEHVERESEAPEFDAAAR